MDKELFNLLEGETVVDIVDAIIARMELHGTITPSVVNYAESLIPTDYISLRPLFMDLAAGTSRARSLGKAHPRWVYTRQMAEQCTHPAIAEHHAVKFDNAQHVLEICTGAGHDALAIAKVAPTVTTYESNMTVAAVAATNLLRSGMTRVHVVAEAWEKHAKIPEGVDALWADPSRRSIRGVRSKSSNDYEPLLSDLPHERLSLVGIKTGPADEIADESVAEFSQEFIGYGNECKERILWKGAGHAATTVSLVDDHVFWEPHGRKANQFDADIGTITWLVEPHAAVIASGSIEDLFVELGVQAIDSHIAYGLSDEEVPPSALYQRFRVLRIDDGISEKKIKARLKSFDWSGRTEFKKRGWPGDPESLRSLLPDTNSTEYGVVLICRRDMGHVTIYAQRVDPT